MAVVDGEPDEDAVGEGDLDLAAVQYNRTDLANQLLLGYPADLANYLLRYPADPADLAKVSG